MTSIWSAFLGSWRTRIWPPSHILMYENWLPQCLHAGALWNTIQKLLACSLVRAITYEHAKPVLEHLYYITWFSGHNSFVIIYMIWLIYCNTLWTLPPFGYVNWWECGPEHASLWKKTLEPTRSKVIQPGQVMLSVVLIGLCKFCKHPFWRDCRLILC